MDVRQLFSLCEKRITPEGVFAGVVFALFAMFLWNLSSAESILPREVEEREQDDEYPLVSPLLSCGVSTDSRTAGELSAIKSDVADVLDDAIARGVVHEAGVYYRELNDGGWFGIGESLEFTPGSLLKVPLAMSLMRVRERDSSFVANDLEFTGTSLVMKQEYPPQEYAEVGKKYSLEDLLRLSLTFSDNGATHLLAAQLDREKLEAAYRDLGIKQPTEQNFTMSVRTYASFFRILYNGTYNSPKDSNYLLSLLAQSTFKEGIEAGVPDDITVAHKFGERTSIIDEYEQLHDCGIVYHHTQPYVLCVMLRGKTIPLLAPVIARISRVVYEGSDERLRE